jgi:hypothetical protein
MGVSRDYVAGAQSCTIEAHRNLAGSACSPDDNRPQHVARVAASLDIRARSDSADKTSFQRKWSAELSNRLRLHFARFARSSKVPWFCTETTPAMFGGVMA